MTTNKYTNEDYESFTKEDWEIERAVGNTKLGFKAWQKEMLESAAGYELLPSQYVEEGDEEGDEGDEGGDEGDEE